MKRFHSNDVVVLCAMAVLLLAAVGYGLAYGWRTVPCANGSRTRQERTYALLHRPRTQPVLFTLT